MPFPFEGIRGDRLYSWYREGGEKYAKCIMKIADGENILTCESIMDALCDEKFRDEEHKKINAILLSGDVKKFEMALRRFILTDIHTVHNTDNLDCPCHKDPMLTRREQCSIINMFDLLKFNKNYLNIYLNMISSFTIVSNDFLYKTYLENVVSREFNEWLHTPHRDKDKAIWLMNKLRDQYRVRFYLIDFTEHTRDDHQYLHFPFEVDRSAVMEKVNWFLENKQQLRNEWDPMRKFNSETFDYDMIYVYTWQLAKYKFDDFDRARYEIKGKNTIDALILRRLQCLVVLITNMNIIDHHEPETDSQKFEEQCARAYHLISWLMTLKEYYSAAEWARFVGIVKNTPKNDVLDSDDFFERCPWTIKYESGGYNDLLMYVIDKI
jgi:hypothetical protein